MWDFGETGSDIRQKRNAFITADLDLQAEKMTLILDAVDAYLGYIDAAKKYDSEIESLMFDLDTLVKSLANSREYISENEISRANTKLSEIEIELQSLAGRVAYIKSSI